VRDFDESELATARRFLIAMTEVVTTSRRNRDRALSTDGEVRREPGKRIGGTGQ
jgi:hypothetical protein